MYFRNFPYRTSNLMNSFQPNLYRNMSNSIIPNLGRAISIPKSNSVINSLLGGKSISSKIGFGSILNNISKTISTVNQAMPIINQVKPLFGNVKTIYNVFKSIGSNSSTSKTTTENKIKEEPIIENTTKSEEKPQNIYQFSPNKPFFNDFS